MPPDARRELYADLKRPSRLAGEVKYLVITSALAEEQALDAIALRTRQFARRQRTWYRKFAIEWLPAGDPAVLARALAHWGWDTAGSSAS